MTTAIDNTACPPETPEEILLLLREQIPLLARLESCASKQRSLITGDDTGSLLSLLADRRKISSKLADIGSRLEPIRREWAVHRERFTPAQRDDADRLLTDIQERLARVMTSDEQDARLLAARKQASAETLRTTHSMGQAISAYRTAAPAAERVDQWNEAT